MGRPDFRIIQLLVDYDLDGKPVAVKYWDQEGCGHESNPFPVNVPIEGLTLYHLRHAKVAHEMVIPDKCPELLKMYPRGGDVPVSIRCSLDVHDSDTKHVFEW